MRESTRFELLGFTLAGMVVGGGYLLATSPRFPGFAWLVGAVGVLACAFAGWEAFGVATVARENEEEWND